MALSLKAVLLSEKEITAEKICEKLEEENIDIIMEQLLALWKKLASEIQAQNYRKHNRLFEAILKTYPVLAPLCNDPADSIKMTVEEVMDQLEETRRITKRNGNMDFLALLKEYQRRLTDILETFEEKETPLDFHRKIIELYIEEKYDELCDYLKEAEKIIAFFGIFQSIVQNITRTTEEEQKLLWNLPNFLVLMIQKHPSTDSSFNLYFADLIAKTNHQAKIITSYCENGKVSEFLTNVGRKLDQVEKQSKWKNVKTQLEKEERILLETYLFNLSFRFDYQKTDRIFLLLKTIRLKDENSLVNYLKNPDDLLLFMELYTIIMENFEIIDVPAFFTAPDHCFTRLLEFPITHPILKQWIEDTKRQIRNARTRLKGKKKCQNLLNDLMNLQASVLKVRGAYTGCLSKNPKNETFLKAQPLLSEDTETFLFPTFEEFEERVCRDPKTIGQWLSLYIRHIPQMLMKGNVRSDYFSALLQSFVNKHPEYYQIILDEEKVLHRYLLHLRKKNAFCFYPEGRKELARLIDEMFRLEALFQTYKQKDYVERNDEILPVSYPENVIRNLKQSTEVNPVDYRDQYTITIDPSRSPDLDDALYVKRDSNGDYILYVHITDVVDTLKINPEVDKIAALRGTSVYLSRSTLHMLPEVLATQNLSLLQNKERNTFSYSFRFKSDGTLKDYQLQKGVITVRNRLNPYRVEAVLKQTEPSDLKNQLYQLRDLATLIRAFMISESREQKPNFLMRCGEVDIVASAATIVNYIWAREAYENHYPIIYRNSFIENQAFYSPDNVGHCKLGLSAYSHFTSPLHLYASAFNEKVLQHYVIEKRHDLEDTFLYDLCDNLNRRERVEKLLLKDLPLVRFYSDDPLKDL